MSRLPELAKRCNAFQRLRAYSIDGLGGPATGRDAVLAGQQYMLAKAGTACCSRNTWRCAGACCSRVYNSAIRPSASSATELTLAICTSINLRRMGQPSQLGGVFRNQGHVAGVIVDHQMDHARLVKGYARACRPGWPSSRRRLRAGRHRAHRTDTIDGRDGLVLAGIELAHRHFVGTQATSPPEKISEPVRQRLQDYTDASDPFGQYERASGARPDPR